MSCDCENDPPIAANGRSLHLRLARLGRLR
jgi:hypothetical protein